MNAQVEADVLGLSYERRTIDLGRDDEGPVIATLVRRRSARQTHRAVLYVHGFSDYFFQTHLADFFVERGWSFYALDLRKYGRSLLPHQTANFCREATDYFPELDAAAEIIRADDGHRTLLAVGHSTGGLLVSLWAHHRGAGIVDGLVLNSPFFDFNVPWFVRRPVMTAACRLGRARPYRILPVRHLGTYGRTLHSEYQGEWHYDLTWKSLYGTPIRLGWLSAMSRAHRQVRAGLDIRVPVLVGCSTRTFRGGSEHELAARADTVLDVEQIARWAPNLGRHVTVIRFEDGMHDLFLSAPAVRRRVFDQVGRWIDAYVQPAPADAAPTVTAEVLPVGADDPDASPTATGQPDDTGQPIATGQPDDTATTAMGNLTSTVDASAPRTDHPDSSSLRAEAR